MLNRSRISDRLWCAVARLVWLWNFDILSGDPK